MSDAQNDPLSSDAPSYGPWRCFDCKKIIEKGGLHAYRATGVEFPGVNENGLVTHFVGHRYLCIPCNKERDDAEIRNRLHRPQGRR